MPTTAQAAAPTVVMQGVTSENTVVDPQAFFANTRRLLFAPSDAALSLGTPSEITLRQSGIVSGLWIRVYGTLTFGGTITGTIMSNRWPYGLLKNIRLSANGQSNLVNTNGWALKALACTYPDSQDRGVTRKVRTTAAQNQGTLSLASEDWGTVSTNTLGQGADVPATGAYNVDLLVFIPVAYDRRLLTGALYAQTAATNLTLAIDWASPAEIVTLGGSATLSSSLRWSVHEEVFSIPLVGGKKVIPDLSAFHSIITNRFTTFGNGENEFLLPGTGPGRQLMRAAFQVWNGSPTAPLAINTSNFGQLAWRYGGNDTPEYTLTGQQLRYINEALYNSDVGFQGFGIWDWANEWAFRDSVDEGAATDLRLVVTIGSGVTLSGQSLELTQQTIFAGPAGA